MSEELRDAVVEAVRADLDRRSQIGLKKYGGPLATNPADLLGKLTHAYEEVLDLANYLKWATMELEGDPALQPDPNHNTGLKPTISETQLEVNRQFLGEKIRAWVENIQPDDLRNRTTAELQDELQRRKAIVGVGVFCPSCTDSTRCRQLGFCMYMNGQNGNS